MRSPRFPEQPKLLVFDLDGTLIDSAEDLSRSVNAMLQQLDRPALPPAVIAGYIGDGASMLVRRALGDPEGEPDDDEYVTRALGLFLDYYREHKLDHTRLYPGVRSSLERLRDAYPDCLMAVLTNKPVNASREICAGLDVASFFFQIYGGNSFHTKKPDPLGLQTLMRETALATGSSEASMPTLTVMIGDSSVDVLTAQRSGAASIGCTFGFAPESLKTVAPTALAHSPDEWVTLLAVSAALPR